MTRDRNATPQPAWQAPHGALFGLLCASGACSGRQGSAGARSRPRGRRRGDRRQQGVALLMVLTIVAILSVFLADLHQSTSTAFAVAMAERDRLKAEYLAKSGLGLTRLLIAKEPQIRQVVSGPLQMLTGRKPPQINIWRFANEILGPFFNRPEEANAEGFSMSNLNLGEAEGLGGTGGEFEIQAVSENAKININKPLYVSGNDAFLSLAQQIFSLLGGWQSPSPYDPMFNNPDPDGNYTTRQDVVSAVIDWWDPDEQRTVFEPPNSITTAGGEGDIYQRLDDPYRVKNAPFDSIEELRLIRGIGDDFWATFIEPEPDDIHARRVTIYGSGWVNPNEAPPDVLLARLCSLAAEQLLCADLAEAAKFVQLFQMARSFAPIPWFSSKEDFVNFVEGKGGARDLYPMLKGMLGENNPLLFQPVSLSKDARKELLNRIVTSAAIFSIQSTAQVGRARVRVRAVVNFHDRWTPPPPNSGTLPGLGVLHYYRVD